MSSDAKFLEYLRGQFENRKVWTAHEGIAHLLGLHPHSVTAAKTPVSEPVGEQSQRRLNLDTHHVVGEIARKRLAEPGIDAAERQRQEQSLARFKAENEKIAEAQRKKERFEEKLKQYDKWKEAWEHNRAIKRAPTSATQLEFTSWAEEEKIVVEWLEWAKREGYLTSDGATNDMPVLRSDAPELAEHTHENGTSTQLHDETPLPATTTGAMEEGGNHSSQELRSKRSTYGKEGAAKKRTDDWRPLIKEGKELMNASENPSTASDAARVIGTKYSLTTGKNGRLGGQTKTLANKLTAKEQ